MGAIERLTAKQVEHAKPKRGKRSMLLSDDGNLYLQAKRTRDGEDVNRSWITSSLHSGPSGTSRRYHRKARGFHGFIKDR
jgi:hypothetical protein